MNEFLSDFKQHHATERYVTGALPDLPFADHAFALVLCSHCLFSYAAQLDEEFQLLILKIA